MDEKELSAIEERARDANQGGWWVDSIDPGSVWGVGDAPSPLSGASYPVAQNIIDHDTADFIAHAGGDNGDVLRLVAEVRRLRAERRWVPVREELPPHSGAVLVSYRHGVAIAHYIDCADGERGWLLSGGQAWAEGVTHWMCITDKADDMEGWG